MNITEAVGNLGHGLEYALKYCMDVYNGLSFLMSAIRDNTIFEK